VLLATSEEVESANDIAAAMLLPSSPFPYAASDVYSSASSDGILMNHMIPWSSCGGCTCKTCWQQDEASTVSVESESVATKLSRL